MVSLPAPCLGAQPSASKGKVYQESIPCIPEEGNGKVLVRVSSPGGIGSVRIYFRYTGKAAEKDLVTESAVADEDKNPYSFLEMRQGQGGDYWAVLPKTEGRTTAVQYRIVSSDGENLKSSSDLFTVPVQKSCSAGLNEDEKKYATNLVIGLTIPEQSFVPKGFLCDGIVSQITVKGDLKPAECGRKVAAIWLAAAAAGLAGAGVVIGTGGGGTPVSPVRPATAPPPAPGKKPR